VTQTKRPPANPERFSGSLPGPSLPGLGSSWPAGQLVDTFDSTPAPISAAVFNGRLFLFWQANDPSNRIWFSSASLDFQLTITDSATGGPIPNAVCENSTEPFAYRPIGLSLSQPGGVGADNVYVMGIPQNTTMLWTAPGYSEQEVSNVGPGGTVLSSAAITLEYAQGL
jgi:hypothetical protein